MSARQTSHRDKRVSKLSRESEKLRKEITELEDALILHSRFQAEDDDSLRGMIRREVGGSRWEHGGEGRLHTYRSNRDLGGLTGREKRKHVKEASSNSLSHRKEMDSQKISSKSTNSKTHKHSIQHSSLSKNGSSLKTEKDGRTLEKTCLNGEWALHKDKTAKIPSLESNQGKLFEIGTLKNKVLEKASSKVIKRKDWTLSSENKNNLSEVEKRSSKEIHAGNKDTFKSKDKKKKENLDKNKEGGDISYSLSFLESLHDTEMKESNSYENTTKQEDKKSKLKQKDICPSRDELNREKAENCDIVFKKNSMYSLEEDVVSDPPIGCLNTKGSDSHRWATERETKLNDSQKELPSSKRRNSVGGNCQHMSEETSKAVSKNRQSQPICDSDRHNENSDTSDFPQLFGSVPKPFANYTAPQSQNSGSHVHITVSEGSEKSNQMQGFNMITEDDEFSSMGNTPATTLNEFICDIQVQSWLKNLGLQDVDQYISLFANHQMDMSSVKLLSAGGLREMGIHVLGPIMKIIKGVQVLNRESSSKEDAASKKSVEEKIHEIGFENSPKVEVCNSDEIEISGAAVESVSQTISGDINVGDKTTIEADGKSGKETTHIKSPTSHPSTLSWKKTSDEAEYVNLNDRSPVDDVKIPQAVSIKEKASRAEKEKKNITNSKIGQRKVKSASKTEGRSREEGQSSSKVMKKPPIKNKCGIITAHEKFVERKKQEELRLQSDQITSARQRQMRDKMAARHTSRRSSSLERKSSSRGHQGSLNRTFSECQNKEDEVFPDFEIAQGIEGFLKTTPVGFNGSSRDAVMSRKTNATITTEDETNDFFDEANKDFDNAGNPNPKETLNLTIIRELKKQLNHIEQHLVQKLEPPTSARENEVIENNQEKASQHVENVNKDTNVRTSARERRRQRTPKHLISTLEGNNDTPLDFLKVGGILSHRKLIDNKAPSHDEEEAKMKVNTRDGNMLSPKTSVMPAKNEELSVEMKWDTSPNTQQNNSRTELKQSTQKPARAPMNTDVQPQGNTTITKVTRQTEMARGKLALAQEYLRKIEIDKKDICFEKEDFLGDGAFSQVYKGIYQGSEVAVKQLKTSLTTNDKNYFSAEVSLLQELRHPHVVMLLGVCTAYTCPALVLEYLQGGNLYKRLHDFNLSPLSKMEFFQISRDIASGLCYLHNHRPPVLHLDLKSRNVLLGFGNRAKVADFGFSKWKHETDIRMSRSSKSRLTQGSPAWMAPELLSAGDITPKADVYSFAIALWEMLTREDPYKGCSTFQILERVRMCQRLPLLPGCPQGLKQLMERCWEQNPCIRPTFKEILKDLDGLSVCEEWIITSSEIVEGRQSRNGRGSLLSELQFSHENVDPSLAGAEANLVEVGNHSEDMIEVTDIDMNRVNEKLGVNVVQTKIEKGSEAVKENSFTNELDNKNKIKTYEEDKKNFAESVTKNLKYLSSSETSLLTSPRVSVDEIKKSGIGNHDTMEPYQSILDIQNDIRSSDSDKRFPSKIAKQNSETEAHSSAQFLLESAHTTKRLDDLMYKYLPSPRTERKMRKENSMFSSGDTAKKLLPFRQSLEKPRKAPKPINSGRLAISKSENFGNFNDDNDAMSVKKPQDNTVSVRESKDIAVSMKESKDNAVSVRESKDNAVSMRESKDNAMSVRELKDNAISLRESKDNAVSVRETKDNAVSVRETKDNAASMRESKDKAVSVREEQGNLMFVKGVKDEQETKYDSECTLLKNSVESSQQKSEDVKNLSLDHGEAVGNERLSQSRASLLPSVDKSQHLCNEGNGTSVQNEKESSSFSCESSKIGEKLLSTAPSSSKFSDTQDFGCMPLLLSKSPQLFKLDSVNSFKVNDDVPQNVLNVSCKEESLSLQLNNSQNSNSSCKKNESNRLIDLESSYSSDMSEDSLSQSLSDEADSFGITKGDLRHFSDKKKKSRVKTNKKNSSLLSHNKTSHNEVMFSTPINKNPRTHPNVRESFFLFSDFHLDLNKLSDNDSDPEEITPTVSPYKVDKGKHKGKAISTKQPKSHSSGLSPKMKQLRGKDLDLQERHSTQKKSLHLAGAAGSSSQTANQSQPINYKQRGHPEMNPSFLLAKSHKEKKATANIPPPPSLKSNPIRKNTKDHSNPVKSGFPIKSSSSKPEVQGHSRFSVEPGLLLQQRNKLKSVLPKELSPVKEKATHGRSMPSVASILKKAMDERRLAMGDNLESQEATTTPEASWSLQD